MFTHILCIAHFLLLVITFSRNSFRCASYFFNLPLLLNFYALVVILEAFSCSDDLYNFNLSRLHLPFCGKPPRPAPLHFSQSPCGFLGWNRSWSKSGFSIASWFSALESVQSTVTSPVPKKTRNDSDGKSTTCYTTDVYHPFQRLMNSNMSLTTVIHTVWVPGFWESSLTNAVNFQATRMSLQIFSSVFVFFAVSGSSGIPSKT